ncbi:hypothetical protein ACFLYA_01525, partial [Candidatus Dependentiae bacterium]
MPVMCVADMLIVSCFILDIISLFKPGSVSIKMLLLEGSLAVFFSPFCFGCYCCCYDWFWTKKIKRIIDRLKTFSSELEENEAESKENR